LCGRTAILEAQKKQIEISQFTRKHFLLPEIVNEMENQTEQDKICTGNFTIRREICPPIILNSQKIPQAEDAKYLGLHFDCRRNWR